MEKIQPIFIKFIIVVYFILILGLAIYNFIKPYYSYDLIPYTASSISLDQNNKASIHNEAYKVVKESLPINMFKTLTSGDFGQKMYKDSVSFDQQLNFYKVKPLYIFIIYGINKLGLGIVKAITLVSVLSFVGISCLLFLFINKLRNGHIGVIILSLLMVCQPFILMAGRNTPDTFSAFLILSALFLILNKNTKVLPGIFLILSIAVRPDNLIIVGALILYFGFLSPKKYRFKQYQALPFLFLSLILYFSISILEHSYGWKTLFTVSFLHTIERPADTLVNVSMNDYVKVLLKNGLSVLDTHLIYLLILGLTGILGAKIVDGDPVFKHMIVLAFGVMFFYFLLFPSQEVDRYFITEYLMILIFNLRILCDSFILKNASEEINSQVKVS